MSLEPGKILMKDFPSLILAAFHRWHKAPPNHLYTTVLVLEGHHSENVAHPRLAWAMQYDLRRTGAIQISSRIPFSTVNNDVFKICVISYLSNVREKNSEISSLPIFLLPRIQPQSNLFHHPRCISFSSLLWIAVYTSYPVAHHFLNFVVSPCNQSPFPISFAARKYLSGCRRWGGRVHQDPKRDASIAR